ncbi:MAG TPA: hypothetical protein PLH94_06130 [Fimbriimonadaceae bacterium]|nr:hypothetical protein [Fimbriimonadaceae bacterium]
MKRGPVPPNRTGLIMLAAAAIPVVVQAARPIAKAVGRGLIRAGQYLREAADGVARKGEPTETAPEASTEASETHVEATTNPEAETAVDANRVEAAEPTPEAPVEKTVVLGPASPRKKAERRSPAPAGKKADAKKKKASQPKASKSAPKSGATASPAQAPRKRRQLPDDLDVT